MQHGRSLAAATALSLLIGAASPAAAQTRADCERQYVPQRGQEGKDVVWAPTEDAILVRMLEMARVTPADKLYDLGSGDGKIPIAAAKLFGASAVGIEFERDLVLHARCLAAAERVADRVTFVQGDLFAADFSDATVVTLYLLPEMNLKLRPTLLSLKPGTRVVSYSFAMGEWEPDDQIDSFGDGSAFFWLVPANAGGRWTFRPTAGGERFDVELDQAFQKIGGSTAGGARVTGRLRGARIELAFAEGGDPALVVGTVERERIVATVTRAGTAAEYVGARY